MVTTIGINKPVPSQTVQRGSISRVKRERCEVNNLRLVIKVRFEFPFLYFGVQDLPPQSFLNTFIQI